MVLLIGDVQGCGDALERLLALAGFSPSRHRLVVLGDLVNRGPASLAVLRRLSSLGNAAQALLGNHDLHLLAVSAGAQALRAGDTLAQTLAAPDAAPLLDWLRHRPLALQESGWLCVHAGVPPQWSAAQTLAAAAEVQAVLQGEGFAGLMQHLYGDEPRRWSEDLQGHERWRFIVNALTRLRFCTEDGALDLQTKEGAAAAPWGHAPWFSWPHRATRDAPVAFGHWSTLGLVNQAQLLGLDSGCVWGGALTAARVDGGRREILQVPCAQAQRPGVTLGVAPA